MGVELYRNELVDDPAEALAVDRTDAASNESPASLPPVLRAVSLVHPTDARGLRRTGRETAYLSEQDPARTEAEWATGHSDAKAHAQPVYEPPQMTVLGTLGELTRGSNPEANTDATFPGSFFG